jgi:hypothetical protein
MPPERLSEDNVLVVILLVAVLALAAVWGLTRWIRRGRSLRRVIDAPDSQPRRVINGDVLSRYLMTSGSLGRLEFHDWGIRIHGIAVSKWVVPTWEARYEELALAELVASQHSRIAVWFRLRDQADGIGFLSHFSDEMLRRLAEHDVPVNRSLTKFRQVSELYGSRK